MTIAPYLQRIIKIRHSPNRVSVHMTVFCFFLNQLINVVKHKVNCFHRSINRFMIDSCPGSSFNIIKHAYQRKLCRCSLSCALLPSDFKINKHYLMVKTFYLYLHSNHKLHITVCAQYFSGFVSFRSAKYQYPCGYWYFVERNGTAQNMNSIAFYVFLELQL